MIDHRRYVAPPALLRDKVIMITGASSGLGRALALACARHGAQVVLGGRRKSALDAVYDMIEAQGGPAPALAPLDLASANAAQYDELVAAIEREFGRLDGLVHAAALLGDRSPIEQYDVATWFKVMHVDLTAPFILTQALMPTMRRSSAASIVFVSSGVVRRPRAYWGAYAAAKAGLEALSDMLALEVEAEGRIRVNSVNPGAMRTPMRAAAYPAEDPQSVPDPASVASTFLYLLGADSRDVNGRHFDLQA